MDGIWLLLFSRNFLLANSMSRSSSTRRIRQGPKCSACDAVIHTCALQAGWRWPPYLLVDEAEGLATVRWAHLQAGSNDTDWYWKSISVHETATTPTCDHIKLPPHQASNAAMYAVMALGSLVDDMHSFWLDSLFT